MCPLQLYSSSAGSGKTYTLTRSFLMLVLPPGNPLQFRRILAVTFTNKATAEMKHRVVHTLNALRNGQESGMCTELSGLLNMPETQIRQRAQEVLSEILHHYTGFSISTIDSFFQKIIRSFTREMGLQVGYRLEIDEAKVRKDVLVRLMERVGTDTALTDLLGKLVLSKVNDGKSWNVDKALDDFMGELFKESFKRIAPFFLDEHLNSTQLSSITQALKGKRDEILLPYNEKAKSVKGLLDTNGWDASHFFYGKNGPVNWFLRVLELESQTLPDVNSYWQTVLSDATPASKLISSKGKKMVSEAESQQLVDLMHKVMNTYPTDSVHVNTIGAVLDKLELLTLLVHFFQELRAYRDEHDLMLISDSAELLNKVIGSNDAPFIYEKVGTQYQHYLIDEFQDTSLLQWQNFRPLLDNSLSQGQYNLIVGDVKQSIYRFRGGDWNLLLNQVDSDLRNYQPVKIPLNFNYRSKPGVIHFNNRFFSLFSNVIKDAFLSNIKDCYDQALLEKMKNETRVIEDAYKDVNQIIPEKSKHLNEGYVELRFFENDSKNSSNAEQYEDNENEMEEGVKFKWKDKAMEALPALVDSLLDDGFELRDIAFLVEANKEADLILHVFGQHQQNQAATSSRRYDILSTESLYLNGNPAIRLIMALVKCLANTQNTLVRAEAAFLYQAKGSAESWNESRLNEFMEYNEQKWFSFFPDSFSSRFARLGKLPIYEMVLEIIRLLNLSSWPQSKTYLQYFEDHVLKYLKDNPSDIDAFVEWWEDEGKLKSIIVSDQQNAMQIATIHKSKGLEYRVVIMPFLHLMRRPNFEELLWCKTPDALIDIIQNEQLKFLPVKKGGALLKTFFAEEYCKEQLHGFMDMLNKVYVAFTRAKERMYVFSELKHTTLEEGGKQKQGNPLLDCVDLLVKQGNQGQEQLAHLHVLPPDAKQNRVLTFWMGQLQAPQKSIQPVHETESSLLKKYPIHDWKDKLYVKAHKPSEEVMENQSELSNVMFGNLVHAALADLDKLNQIPEVVEKYTKQESLSDEQSRRLNELLIKIAQLPQVQNWFNGHYHIKNEVTVLLPSGSLFRPDKVLIKDQFAWVVDFKTGHRSAKHLKQVKEYMGILQQMGYLQVQGSLLYTDDLTFIEVN